MDLLIRMSLNLNANCILTGKDTMANINTSDRSYTMKKFTIIFPKQMIN